MVVRLTERPQRDHPVGVLPCHGMVTENSCSLHAHALEFGPTAAWQCYVVWPGSIRRTSRGFPLPPPSLRLVEWLSYGEELEEPPVMRASMMMLGPPPEEGPPW